MYFSVEKIRQRIDELAKLRYRDQQPLNSLFVQKIDNGGAGERFDLRIGDRWGERDALYNVFFTVDPPKDWLRSGQVALHLDLSELPDAWTINTIEGLVYLNDQPFHAVDRYHREMMVPRNLLEQGPIHGRIHLWTGINEDFHTATCAEVRWIDEAADHLYKLMGQVYDQLTGTSADSATYHALLTGLEASCLQLDYRNKRSQEFYSSCQKAYQVLNEHLQSLMQEIGRGSDWQPHYLAIGHAHIDVAWLWRLRHTRLKAANTFTTALHHMDRYPHFRYIQSQPQLYQFIKEDHPEIYARIKEKVASGQWEAEGASWVEPDTNITGAESLVRQLVEGQRFFKEEFGRRSMVMWLPDVFGYSAALPQLLKGAGVEYFITTKISWSEINRVPMDTFQWQGLDGTEILSHFITVKNEARERYDTYNAYLKPGSLQYGWNNYRQKDLNRELLVAYGYGDGGGGPTSDQIEATEGYLNHSISRELPTVEPGTIANFMQRLDQRVGKNPDLPTWVGELYLEYHRGTYTSQARTKRQNRLSERDMHNAEWLGSLALHLCGLEYPMEEYHRIWRTLLTNHFHDILPGSSITEVYQDALKDFQEIRAFAQSRSDQAIKAISSAIDTQPGTLVVCNPTGWTRDGLIEVESGSVQNLLLPKQELAESSRILVEARSVPSLGYRAYAQGTSVESPVNTFTVEKNLLESEAYRIEFNDRGQITSLLDKQANGGAGREVLIAGERGNVFSLFEDKPLAFDAWDINDYYEQKSQELDNLVSVQVLEQGPLRATLEFKWVYQERTAIAQRVCLYRHSRRIDFMTHVDWHERQTLLKVAFPVEISSNRATAEIQFGNLERPTHRNTSWEKARFEYSAHKWVDLSEGDYGVGLLNDCKYGYDIHGSVMRQTLLKGAVWPDPTADLGEHDFTYSLLPHQGSWFEGGVQREAYELNYPLLSIIKEGDPGVLPTSMAVVQIDVPNVVIETVKRAEESEGIIVRVYESARRRGQFHLYFPFEVERVEETNLLENQGQPVDLALDGRSFESSIRPFEIKTFVVFPRPNSTITLR